MATVSFHEGKAIERRGFGVFFEPNGENDLSFRNVDRKICGAAPTVKIKDPTIQD